MMDDEDFHIPMTSADLRHEIEKAVELRYQLESQLAAAHRLAQPFEGMGAVANVPGLPGARSEIKRLPTAIEQVENRIESLSRTFAERRLEEERARREGGDFWFRRFMLSLQIGNGAAFLATVGGILHADKEVLSVMAVLAWAPAMYFALGVVAAGLLPLLMFLRQSYAHHPRLARAVHVALLCFTSFSMGFFALGAGSVVVEITQLRQPAMEAALRARPQPGAGNRTANEPAELRPAVATQKRATNATGVDSPVEGRR